MSHAISWFPASSHESKGIMKMPFSYTSRILFSLTFVLISVIGFAPCKSLPSRKTQISLATTTSLMARIRPIPYIATVSTAEHGQAIAKYLRKGDSVLELGSQLDSSTEMIIDSIGAKGRATLVDVKRTETNSGRTSQGSRNVDKILTAIQSNENGKHDFIELDRFAQWKSVFEARENQHFDALVLDATAMLGNDLELTSISVINEFVNEMRRKQNLPRVVLVKSKSIASLSRRLIHAQRLFDGTTEGDFKSPSRDGRPYIVAGVGVEEYRRAIPYIVKKGDKSVEVGCFSGTTTALVHEAADPSNGGYCIGVDIGPKIIERAKREHPGMEFAVGDGFRVLDLLRVKQAAYPATPPDSILDGYDVVFAVIGGLSGPDGLLESLSLISTLSNALEPRCICIKSLCMRRLASSLRSYSATLMETREKTTAPKQ